MFVMHLEGNRYKVGATYNWDLKEPVCTEEGKKELYQQKCDILIISICRSFECFVK